MDHPKNTGGGHGGSWRNQEGSRLKDQEGDKGNPSQQEGSRLKGQEGDKGNPSQQGGSHSTDMLRQQYENRSVSSESQSKDANREPPPPYGYQDQIIYPAERKLGRRERVFHKLWEKYVGL